MPVYDFKCGKCGKSYEFSAKYDSSGEYPGVNCSYCGSSEKTKMVSCFSFRFGDPVGTDVWNNSHDYRFKHKLPSAVAERKASDERLNGANPYPEIDDLNSCNFGEVK